MKRTILNIPLVAGLALMASDPSSAAETFADDYNSLGDYVEGPKWQEEAVTSFPDWPNDDNLLKVQIDNIDAPFQYYLDSGSLSVGKDGVSRYTIVIESGSGARNILYEGIRCRTREYRVYAYGGIDQKFDKAIYGNWSSIENDASGSMVHRFNMHQYYLCDALSSPRKVEEVIQEVRYPRPFKGSGLHLD